VEIVRVAEVGQQLLLVLAVLGVTFTGPGVAIALLLRRKRVTRAARRSPLTADLLRGPGHALRERLDELRSDVGFDVAVLMIIPNMLMVTYLLQLHFLRLAPSMWVNLTLVIVCVAVVAHSIRSMLAKSAEADKLRKGLDAEVAVGQELDQLMRQGAAVYHDFQAEKFNIDHIVIAAQGVFCVETKGYTKPVDADGPASARVDFDGRVLRFPNWQTSKPLEQVERNAQWFAKWLTGMSSARDAGLSASSAAGSSRPC
jgi:hypothetical protein